MTVPTADGLELRRDGLPPRGPGRLRARMSSVAARLVSTTTVPNWLQSVHAAPERHRASRVVSRLLPQINVALGDASERAGEGVGTQVIPGTSDVTVAKVRSRDGHPLAIVKVPRTPEASTELVREGLVLERLAADDRLLGWRHLVPHSRLCTTGPHLFALEEVVPGTMASRLLAEHPSSHLALVERCLASVSELHERTSKSAVLEAKTVDPWLLEPLAALHAFNPAGTVPEAQHAVADSIGRRLRAALTGRETTLSWIHGDYTPGNVMLQEDSMEVTGIIDWGQARDDGLPALDVLLWVMSVHATRQGVQLGQLVRSALAWNIWPDNDPLLRYAAGPVVGARIELGSLVLLCWLHHVADNIRNTRRYSRRPWWWAANVDPVLEAVAP